MSHNLPKDLVLENSRLDCYYEQAARVNRTKTAIVLSGNRKGFLSLANSIIYLVNSLEQKISVHELPFVHSQIGFRIRLGHDIGTQRYGSVTRVNDDLFTWGLTEENGSLFAVHVHALGHLISELHWDTEMSLDDISVYCVVDDESA